MNCGLRVISSAAKSASHDFTMGQRRSKQASTHEAANLAASPPTKVSAFSQALEAGVPSHRFCLLLKVFEQGQAGR